MRTAHIALCSATGVLLSVAGAIHGSGQGMEPDAARASGQTVLAANGTHANELRLSQLQGWTIVLAEQAIPSERYAAQEFRSLAEQALGFQLAVASEAPEGRPCVRIGPGALAADDRERLHAAGLGEEGCYIRIAPTEIAIAGGRPRGTLYAVYEFWERYCGVRFLTCDHTYAPEGLPATTIPGELYTYRPSFTFRWSFYRENQEQSAFAARLRCNTVTPAQELGGITGQRLIGHSYERQVPYAVYGKDHPEYFALYAGRRVTEAHGGPQICVTNPGVLDIVTKAVLTEIADHPEQHNFVVSQNDNGEYCQCERCEAINRREGSPMGSNLTFVNAVAERVAAQHPEVMIGTLAYDGTRVAPKTLKPRTNVQIQLCSIECCTYHAINDTNCERNKRFMADLAAWKDKTDNIWIWNYNTNFHNLDLPFPNLCGIGDTVKCFADNHVKGVFMQANGVSLSGEMSDLRNYVMSRCLWHPGLDSWELTEEFCRLHYGQAANTILAYLVFLHDNLKAKGLHPGCFCTAPEVEVTPAVATRAIALFKEAMTRAENDVVRRRVEKASLCAYKAMIATHSGYRCEGDGLCRIRVPDNAVEAYLTLHKRYGVTMVTETLPVSEFVDDLKALVSGVPCLEVQSRAWRVSAVPKFNGRVLSLVYRPTGQNLLFNRYRMFTRGRGLEERVYGTRGQRQPAAITGSVEGNTIRMLKTLDDGCTIERLIWCEESASSVVRFKTTVRQGGHAGWHQFGVHPEFDTQTQSDDESVVSAYVLNDGWVKLTGPFDTDNKDVAVLTRFRGGRYAFFNHKLGYGVVESFDPAEYERLRLYWSPLRYQLNLELVTKRVQLQPGQSYSFEYAMGFLEKPPIREASTTP
jgi:hypothetical protein